MTSLTNAAVTGRAPDETHLSALSKALLRISASLDLETVLREVIDGARALTGARDGCIVTIDDSGAPQDFVTSGMTEEEHRQLEQWPEGQRMFQHLRDLPGPFRIADFAEFTHALGMNLEFFLSRTCMCTPMRHFGVHVGNFFLGDKVGGAEFTDEDEEVLLLFAAQGAAAIVNARNYRAEQRARADLEALVETSPIGVVVLDPQTGQPAVVNREARRFVEALRPPGRSAEDMLDAVTCRLSDGREFMLDHVSLSRELTNAGTVRTEEVVLSTEDGGSVSALVNATPIRARDGTVESVMVTLQDLAPLEALDRMRAEFLGMVSHELRTPLAAIKGSTTTVLGTAQSFAAAETRQFLRIIDEQADRMSGLIGDLLDVGRIDSGTLSVAPEASEVGELVEQARTAFLLGGGRHTVLIELPPDLPRVMADRGTHRAGAEQPACQRRPARPGERSDPGRRQARRHAHRGLGLGRGPGADAGTHGAPVPKVQQPRRRRARRGKWTGARHLQGAGRSTWRTHSGRERRAGPRARGLPLRCRWRRTPEAKPTPSAVCAQRQEKPKNGRVSWSWTMTRRCCGSCATHCSVPATPRWSPATTMISPICWRRRNPYSSSST